MPPVYQTRFKEADGTKIPREEWFDLKPGMLPEPMSEESKGTEDRGAEEGLGEVWWRLSFSPRDEGACHTG